MRILQSDYDALLAYKMPMRKWFSLTFRQRPYRFTIASESKRPYKDTGVWPLEWLRFPESEWVMRSDAAATKINPPTSSRKRASCVHACCHARIGLRGMRTGCTSEFVSARSNDLHFSHEK